MYPLEYAEDLSGKRFRFIGRFAGWPALFGRDGPVAHVEARGAQVVGELDAALDYLVVGDGREKGRAEAIRAAEKLRDEGRSPETLDERAFLHLVRHDIAGRAFACVGGFTRGGLHLDGGPAGLLTSHGAKVHERVEAGVEFVVVGERRAKGKTAALREVEALQASGSPIVLMPEEHLLEIMSCLPGQRSNGQGSGDFRTFALGLRRLFNERKVDRALEMLRKQALELYTEVQTDSVGGIVKSQTSRNTHYACWLNDEGQFACSEDGEHECMGLQGSMCKHILTLVIGLARTGDLEPELAEALVRAAARKRPVKMGRRGAELLLRFKGAQAGEIDWRPTETVPEDYYAL